MKVNQSMLLNSLLLMKDIGLLMLLNNKKVLMNRKLDLII